MTRRDTIIIATLVNAGLLACLFVTATRQEDFVSDSPIESFEIAQADTASNKFIATKPQEPKFEYKPREISTLHKTEDVDLALKEFLPDNSYGHTLADSDSSLEADLNPELVKEVLPSATLASQTPQPFNPISPIKPIETAKNSDPKPKTAQIDASKLVEIKVKKGDMLAKIAKANSTTVKAIKEANNLTSDNLRVGQILKVPTGTVSVSPAPSASSIALIDPLTKGSDNALYYTVQSGDNPWKIAKKFHVKFEDILKLNNMTEEKAKNLKVGQEIRVK